MGVSSGLKDPDSTTLAHPHHPQIDSPPGLKKARKKLFTLRERLYRQRLSLKEKRNELKEERGYIDELVDKLLTSISRSWDLGTALDESSIRDLHTEVISKRDELGVLQYDYDQAEEDYDEAEDQLNQQEEDQSEDSDESLPDAATQNARIDSEARPKDYADSQRDIAGLQKQSLPQDTLSSTQAYEFGSRGFSISINDQDDQTAIDHVREASTRGNSAKEDSDHDILEATFFTRAHTRHMTEEDHLLFIEKGRATLAKTRDIPSIWHDTVRWESASDQGFIRDSSSRSKPYSDSGVTQHRRGLIRRRSRITWWLFNTFGSSGVDYVERARDKLGYRDLENLDDEEWARIVYGHWIRKSIPPAVTITAGEDKISVDSHEPSHVEVQSLGGSYLLLPSGHAKLKHSVDVVDRLLGPIPQASTYGPELLQSHDIEFSALLSRTKSQLS